MRGSLRGGRFEGMGGGLQGPPKSWVPLALCTLLPLWAPPMEAEEDRPRLGLVKSHGRRKQTGLEKGSGICSPQYSHHLKSLYEPL